MTYKLSAKNRKFKGKIIKFLRALKFKWDNSWLHIKLMFFWNVILIFSLFMNWSITNNPYTENIAFSALSWLSWYVLLIISLVSLFLIFSNNKKEEVKLNLPIKINEISFLTHSIILQTIILFLVFFFIRWLYTFSANVVYWRWIIFAFLWIALNIIWLFFMLKNYDQEKEKVLFANESSQSNEIKKNLEKNNMKLPF